MASEDKQGSARSLVVLPRELGHQLPSLDDVGAKAHHLARLLHLKARVPRFGVLLADAFDAHLASDSLAGPFASASECTDDAALVAAAEAVANAARSAPLSTRIREALDELVDAFTESDLLAIRPSVVGPASEVLTMGGMLETFLFVRGKTAVREAVHLIYASAFSPSAVAARIDAGLDPLRTRCAIVVQRMVMADSSGAVASLDIDAAAGRSPKTIVEATLGLGGGSSRPKAHLASDIFRVDRPLLAEEKLSENAGVESEVARKAQALVLDEAQGHGSVLLATDPAAADRPSLTPVQARVVAEEALRLESATGRPVALEFAFSGRLLHVLQLHPLETPEGRISSNTERIFDARVLPEDIAGTALPATQSLARRTLSVALKKALVALDGKKPFPVEVGRALDRLVATVDRTLVGNVGALRAALSVLPFEGWESAAFGAAIGSNDFDPNGLGVAARRSWSTWTLLRVGKRLRQHASALQEDATAALSHAFEESERIRRAGVEDHDPDRLADEVDELVTLSVDLRELQWRSRILWALARDALTEHSDRLGLDVTGAFLDDLCTPRADANELGLLRKVDRLCAAASAPVEEILRQDGSAESAVARLEELPDAEAFNAGFAKTLDSDGIHLAERSILEAATFAERPDLLLELVRQQLGRGEAAAIDRKLGAAEGRRKKAEYLASSQAQGRALFLFKHDALLLRLAATATDAAAINLISSRLSARVTGVLRQVLLALGSRLYEHDLLDQPTDGMWLTLDEAVGVVRGSAADLQPRTLVAARKRNHSLARGDVDERVVLTGVVAVAPREQTSAPMATADIANLEGRGVAPGEIRGRVHLLHALDGPRLSLDDEFEPVVLVVPSLQLPWLGALAHADAVIAERGAATDAAAMLLHALSIPCVVGVSHARRILEAGEEVIVDGVTGHVTRAHLDVDKAHQAAATAPEDFARLAAPSSDNLVLPRVALELDKTAIDVDRTEPETAKPTKAVDLATPFGVAHTLAVDADQVESVQTASPDDAASEEDDANGAPSSETGDANAPMPTNDSLQSSSRPK